LYAALALFFSVWKCLCLLLFVAGLFTTWVAGSGRIGLSFLAGSGWFVCACQAGSAVGELWDLSMWRLLPVEALSGWVRISPQITDSMPPCSILVILQVCSGCSF
jgi:hypothetical protein